VLGWSTPRKLVCIESDDWGSIRIPNLHVRDILIKKGFRLDSNYFTSFDCLENESDLSTFFSVLNSYKDFNGNSPKVTTLHLLGNPDFNSIDKASFGNYFFQPLDNTYDEYGNDSKSMRAIWREGMNESIITPAFHGREHVNVNRWMRALNNPQFSNTRLFFKYKISGIHPSIAKENREEYQASFDPDEIDDIPTINEILIEGLEAFSSYFGFKAQYFVPPNGCLPIDSIPVVKKKGIDYINTLKWGSQKDNHLNRVRHFRWLGKRGSSGITYTTRNVFFEPSNTERSNWVECSLKEISAAFDLKKPAIISSHRVNYVSGITARNRDKNLMLLSELLSKIIQKWPDVEFLSTQELCNIINSRS
jgi:hypothetical protein